MLKLQQAKPQDLDAIMQFYYEVIEIMDGMTYQPGWIKDVYPTRDYILSSIEAHEFYLAYVGDEIACATMLNHHCSDGYETITWPTVASPEEIFVIHALGVHPKFQGTGLSRKLLEAIMDLCRQAGGKVIRIDVLGSNIPAQKLYPKVGFAYVDTLKLYYDNTGLADFMLYELVL